MAEPRKSSSLKIVAGGITGVVAIAIILVPFVPITAQEEYTVMETRQESYVDIETRTEEYTVAETKKEAYTSFEYKIEEYTDVEYRDEEYTDVESGTEPYTEIEHRSQIVGSFDDLTLEPGESRVFSAYVAAGRSVELIVRAEDTLETFVTSQSAYQARGNSYGNAISTEKVVRYGFTAPIGDTYYFAFRNHHNGFFSSYSVALYSAVATMTWDEEVTKYRDVQVPVTKTKTVEVPVTKERTVKVPVTMYKDVQVPVTKYRDVEVPVTKYRDVEVAVVKVRDVPKSISLLDFLQVKK